METFSALLAFCAGNSPVTGEFPAQGPVTRSFDVFVDLRLNKRLSKQSWGWWMETPYYDVIVLFKTRNDASSFTLRGDAGSLCGTIPELSHAVHSTWVVAGIAANHYDVMTWKRFPNY